VKLTPILLDHLKTLGPVVVARLSVELLDEQEALLQLMRMVGRLDRRRH
jgi:tetraacyldisaccharide 4'-kinase